MAEGYVKAYTNTRDGIADFLSDCQKPDESPAYVEELCGTMYDEALGVVMRSGSYASTDGNKTTLASPWVPYATEGLAPSPPRVLGHIRLEVDLPHMQASGLTLLGNTTVRLAAKSTNESVSPRTMAIFDTAHLIVAGRGGPNYFNADVGDVNHVHSLVHWHLPGILTPPNPTDKMEKERDLAADRIRKQGAKPKAG